MPKTKQAKEIVLAPIGEFENAVKAVFSNSEQESDKQLAEFLADNRKKRQAKKGS
jgi:hypothetical protein